MQMNLNRLFSTSCLHLPRPGLGRAGLIAAITMTSGLGVSLADAQEINAQGWTVLEPSVDTRFIFVSSSSGNDANTGLSPANAVRSFDRAKEMMRDNSADWMLLKRGDVWREGLGTWSLSGRSAEERLVISSYGESDERPKLVISNGSAIGGRMNSEVNNIAIVGLHLRGDRPDEASVTGIRWLSTGENLLIEDCFIEGFKDNITCQAVGGEFRNFALRRSVIADSWSTNGHSQGLYVKQTIGVVVEENVFDHNGWNTSVPDANPTMFNQNVYLQEGVIGIEFHGNITARASAAGVQMRSGGNASNNLVYANGLGIRFGYRTVDWPNESASGSLVGNVVLGGPLAAASLSGAGIGIWVERADNALIKNNVVANFVDGTSPWAYTLNAFAGDVDFIGNVAYDWMGSDNSGKAVKTSAVIEGDVRFIGNRWFMPETDRIFSIRYVDGMEFQNNTVFGMSAGDDVFAIEGSSLSYDEWSDQDFVTGDELEMPQFPDPGRDLDGYAQSIGYSDANAFIEAARGQSRTSWDPRLTGMAAADWIRAGYIVQE